MLTQLIIRLFYSLPQGPEPDNSLNRLPCFLQLPIRRDRLRKGFMMLFPYAFDSSLCFNKPRILIRHLLPFSGENAEIQ